MDFFKKSEGNSDTQAPKVGAMEKMIAGMLGFTPEEMAATLTDFRNTIVGVAATMARIEAKLDAVLTIEGKAENVRLIGSGDGGSDSVAERGRDAGGRDDTLAGSGDRDAA